MPAVTGDIPADPAMKISIGCADANKPDRPMDQGAKLVRHLYSCSVQKSDCQRALFKLAQPNNRVTPRLARKKIWPWLPYLPGASTVIPLRIQQRFGSRQKLAEKSVYPPYFFGVKCFSSGVRNNWALAGQFSQPVGKMDFCCRLAAETPKGCRQRNVDPELRFLRVYSQKNRLKRASCGKEIVYNSVENVRIVKSYRIPICH